MASPPPRPFTPGGSGRSVRYDNPTALLRQNERKFFSSMDKEKHSLRYITNPGDKDSGVTDLSRHGGDGSGRDMGSSPLGRSSSSAHQNGHSGYSSSQRLADGRAIVRPSTAAPTKSGGSLYPSLPPIGSNGPDVTRSGTYAPYSGYSLPNGSQPSNGYYPSSNGHHHASSTGDRYSSLSSANGYRSPPYTPSSPTSSHATSPPISPPVSPPPHSSRGYPSSTSNPHGHSRSMGGSHGYETERPHGSSKLVPSRSSRNSVDLRPTNGYTTSSGGSSMKYGPALSSNIPPVLPRPPSTIGRSASARMTTTMINGSSSLARGASRDATDEERKASLMLNTYSG